MVAVILGQGMIFENVCVLEYGALIWLAFHLFVMGYEEPTLRVTFGPEYKNFCSNASRWIPRLGAWEARNHEAR